jgi:quercetin dioxygenase-like cupin family protein
VSGFVPVDLAGLAATGDGVAWSAAPTGLNVNLVALGPGGPIGEHRNDEVDVLVVVVAGEVTVSVDDDPHHVEAGGAGVIPHGTARGITAGLDGARYLTVHQARGPLQVRATPQRGAP